MGGAFSMMLTCLMAGAAVVAAFFIDRDLKRVKEKQEKGDDK